MEIKSESPIPRRLALSSPAPGSEASGSRLVTSTGTRFESAGPRTKSEPQSQLQDNSTVDLGATTNALIWSENIAVGDETVGSRRLSVSSDSSGTSVSGEQSSENGGEPSRGTVTEIVCSIPLHRCPADSLHPSLLAKKNCKPCGKHCRWDIVVSSRHVWQSAQ